MYCLQALKSCNWLVSSTCLCSGFLLLTRVIDATFCVTLAASLAARHGSISMAAFQVCLQILWATSLLADGLTVAAQDRKWYWTLELSQKLIVLSVGIPVKYS